MQASAEPGIEYMEIGADGSQSDILKIPGGGSRIPASHESVEQKLHTVHANGREVYKLAVRVMEVQLVETLSRCGMTPDDIDLLIPHQANYRIIDAGRRRLGLPWEKVVANIDKYGNTTAATIPIALDEAVRDGRAGPGSRVVLVSFGAGFTWGVIVLKM